MASAATRAAGTVRSWSSSQAGIDAAVGESRCGGHEWADALILAIVVGLTAAGVLLVGESDSASRALTPTYVGTDIRDETTPVRIPLETGKPTVVAFFASWCRQCAAELRTLEWHRQRVGGQVNFVGVDFPDPL